MLFRSLALIAALAISSAAAADITMKLSKIPEEDFMMDLLSYHVPPTILSANSLPSVATERKLVRGAKTQNHGEESVLLKNKLNAQYISAAVVAVGKKCDPHTWPWDDIPDKGGFCRKCVTLSDGSQAVEHFCARVDEGCPNEQGESCCDLETEEMCFDASSSSGAIACAKRSEGGCSGTATSSSDDDKDFTTRRRGTRRGVRSAVNFKYQHGQCLQGKRDIIKDTSLDTVDNIYKRSSDEEEPFLRNLTLNECAKRCIAKGTECVGIDYYTGYVPRYYRNGSIVRVHVAGDCFLVSGVESTMECNEYNMGNVEYYTKEEGDEEEMAVFDDLAMY